MMQVPSLDDDTISRSKQLNCNDAIGAVCSLRTAIRSCCLESIRQIRIWPSFPPDTNKLSHVDIVSAEQPLKFICSSNNAHYY